MLVFIQTLEKVKNLRSFYTTIAEYSKTKKIQISLSFNWIPSNVWIAFRNQQRATLQSTTSQVANHLSSKIRLKKKDAYYEKQEK